jgi:hypothetical protein
MASQKKDATHKNFWLTQVGPGSLHGNFIDNEQLEK